MVAVRNAPNFIFPLVLGSFAAVTYVGFVTVYTAQPLPFIDEIFHIPQAQRYCKGNFFEWDPKITTLPGLYLFSIGLLGPVSWITGKLFCDVFCLRLTNLVGITFILSTIHKLLDYLHGDKIDGWKILLVSLNLSIFPVLYWFTFLYYTEVLSSLLVLIMMLLHVHKAPNTAAVMGILAVLMRQTNIVWVGFLGGLLLVDSLGFHILKAPVQSFADMKKLLRRLRKISSKPAIIAESLANIIVDCLCYIAVIISFLVFVISNGSFVMGDKDSHQATFHFMQIGYFLLFFLFFSLPYAAERLKPFIRFCKNNPKMVVACIVVWVLVIHSNTMVHPYLLSDNRHYTFYIWNRFFGRYELFRYLMIPPYIFGLYIVYSFIANRSFAFKLAFMACVMATLVPQKLVEARYFILPFLILRIQTISQSWLVLCGETLFYILINLITMHMFTTKTFYWEDTVEPQRIMW